MYPDQTPQPNYDFILQSPQKPQRSFTPSGKTGRIITVGGMALVGFILIMVFSSIMSAAGNQASNDLQDLAAYQTELRRVISLGKDRTRDSDLHIKALTASYSLQSQYQTSVGLLKIRKTKLNTKQLSKYNGKSSDTALDAAEKANNFDQVYADLYTEKLTNYQTKLASIYPHLGPNEQKQLKAMNEGVKALLQD